MPDPNAWRNLVDYLLDKVAERDWHGVSDAANDLRVMEAKMEETLLRQLRAT